MTGAAMLHPDDLAVDRFVAAMAAAMKAKLAAKRAEGYGGWDDPAECRAEFLSRKLREHVEKGDPVDVANFAMMLHQRGERIAPAEAEAVTLNLSAVWPPKAPADTFSAQLAEIGVALPVTTTTEDIGVIFDASGRDLLTVDSNRAREDAETALIAGYVALAINATGGARLAPFNPSSPTQSAEQDMEDVPCARR